MRKMIILFCLASLALMTGCGGGKQKYDWCNYSDTYYGIAKNDCEATQIKHKAELERIMDVAAKKNLEVPPGIYAEYGFLLFKSGKAADSMQWYAKEKALYPESAVFVEMLSRAAQRQIDKEKQADAQPQAEQNSQPAAGVQPAPENAPAQGQAQS
ncbi:DUF4810 domain-containing protein [Desulfovibrio mangrovi]|uniref:DUF4810 domain-containing protein n=1 Tax=Desulfovibrio mangrovi TaxID=2976983 RepID=UPI00224586A6|nr:DUF4810 domain-containing protein [Desulfovibrio mangrovi]UZP65967.1 DUF4810 domain-containing protein [Desulfovibrio mangrovi]